MNNKISIGLKRYHNTKRRNNLIKRVCHLSPVEFTSLLIIMLIGLITILGAYAQAVEASAYTSIEVKTYRKPVEEMTVREKIIKYSKEYGVNTDEALAIAQCESSMGTNIISKTSTSRGVYQFIFKTSDTYCEGDVYDEDDNIKCFLKLYPNHKSWWECKY